MSQTSLLQPSTGPGLLRGHPIVVPRIISLLPLSLPPPQAPVTPKFSVLVPGP